MIKRVRFCTIVCIVALIAGSMFPTCAVDGDDIPLTRMEFLQFIYQTDLDNGGNARYFENPTLPLDPAMPLSYYPGTFQFYDIPVDSVDNKIVNWATKNNLITRPVYPYFYPDRSVTREEAAVILRQYLIYLGYGADISDGSLASFADADLISDWAKKAMAWGLSNEILFPTADGHAEPKSTVSRAELYQALLALDQTCSKAAVNRGYFVYLLYSASLQTENPPELNLGSGLSEIPGGPGTCDPANDVSLSSQYMLPVLFATERLHAAPGMFYPGRSITKEEAAVFLWRYAQLVGADTELPEDEILSFPSFPDQAAINDWAQEAVAWAVNNGIMEVDETGRFTPKDTFSMETAYYFIKGLLTYCKSF